MTLQRDPRQASRESYDLLIVGGGIYGAALLLEAARRGLAPLLVERRDFGGATSWNSLRIVHGGLRYLQKLDLGRFRDSVAQRSWWLRTFPDLVEPLPCLMPLYDRGLKRRSAFRAALWMEDLLSRRRNTGLPPDRQLPSGRVLGARETLARFPVAERRGLRGGALWHDARAADSQRLIVEMLRWAAACGGRALNYVAARRLLRRGDAVAGIEAVDAVAGETLELTAPVVVNCAGPWCRELAARLDRDVPALFRPSIALNLLLDRPPPAAEALAVTPAVAGGQVLFLHPWKGRVLAGTFHAPLPEAALPEEIEESLVATFLDRLNAAVPSLELARDDVLRVHWGLLPAARQGGEALASRPVIHDHGADGGPRGLVSVSGVKLTTARQVAEATLRRLFARRGESLPPLSATPRPAPRPPMQAADFEALLRHDREAAARQVRELLETEAVVELEDLMLRRTDWGMLPATGHRLAAAVRELTGWRGGVP